MIKILVISKVLFSTNTEDFSGKKKLLKNTGYADNEEAKHQQM
jgi:hypothetical protein